MLKKAIKKKITPTRAVLLENSQLHGLVCDGLGAVENAHLSCIDSSIRSEFGDSIDIDAAYLRGRESENRWDYILGHDRTKKLIAVEPHSAKGDQVSTVIAKRKAALRHLDNDLKPHARVNVWLWVASGNVQFADTERAKRRLDQNGIKFVGKRVTKKDIPS
ncbi:hypothetical protein [Acidovorax sp. SUPP3334]|uniref:hypothetical protein n=1 Tax=Acidovorax sp. SUPP3334 TaxID=2920881 RepID=UPI0023DE27FE|nr:hypothetical protein [Acidovorax sp. SUPP3334]GKT22652.1 hypothetical protein AVHM3334_09110 [Acidovorax sp. SUPP3334]